MQTLDKIIAASDTPDVTQATNQSVFGGGTNKTYLISGKKHRASVASRKFPVSRQSVWSNNRKENEIPSNIFLMAELWHAASRRTTNSNPSLDTRVTYLLGL
jgi:hypothetical protein